MLLSFLFILVFLATSELTDNRSIKKSTSRSFSEHFRFDLKSHFASSWFFLYLWFGFKVAEIDSTEFWAKIKQASSCFAKVSTFFGFLSLCLSDKKSVSGSSKRCIKTSDPKTFWEPSTWKFKQTYFSLWGQKDGIKFILLIKGGYFFFGGGGGKRKLKIGVFKRSHKWGRSCKGH